MDKHLNCFLSYNDELIENNLTRAFIVTLAGISEATRDKFLSSLSLRFSSYDFSYAKFALQNNIEIDPKESKNKYVVTLSSHTYYSLEDEFKDIEKDIIRITLSTKKPPTGSPKILEDLRGGSIPDAWIYDGLRNDYCFLIECKIGGDCIYYPQIIRHAYEHFGLDDLAEIENCTVKLTWHDILDSFIRIVENDMYRNKQEHFIIENFVQYLGFFGYLQFKGFNFANLMAPSSIKLIIDQYMKLFRFQRLENPPKISLKLPAIDPVLHKELFNFGELGEHLESNVGL